MTIGRASFTRTFMLAVVVATAVAGCADGASAPDAGDATTNTTATAVTTATDETAADTTIATAGATSPGATPDPSPTPGRQPEGFTTVQARITDARGDVCEVCLWLADDATERGRGLMDVTDLGAAVGMAFRFDEATTGSFYMFQTPTPLSIAWFAPDGTHVGSADMDPCLDTEAGECPLYSPGGSYDLAIEAFDGGLEPLGVGPGSRIELIEGSEADRCVAAG